MIAHCEALFTRRRFALNFRDRSRLGLRGWLAVQLVACALLVCGDLSGMSDDR